MLETSLPPGGAIAVTDSFRRNGGRPNEPSSNPAFRDAIR